MLHIKITQESQSKQLHLFVNKMNFFLKCVVFQKCSMFPGLNRHLPNDNRFKETYSNTRTTLFLKAHHFS